ncbi:MAG: YfhO family protein [Candidatus Levybacteria bacterium]|nr:YfhO family protein [Candidatus Levybacteria bacterium]
MQFKRFKHTYLLLLFILPLLFFSKIILSTDSMFFPSQDIVSIFSQEKNLFADTIRTHKTLPLWNPYVFSGSPFIGNPSSSMFYPLNLLFLLFPTDIAFSYMFIVDSILIGFFTFLFARSINLSRFGSFISGLITMFSGPMLTQIFPGHLINLDSFIWLPLILLLYELSIKKQKSVYAIMASIPIALSFFGGASQIAVFSLFSASIYFLLRVILTLPKDKKLIYLSKTFITLAASIAIGLLLASVQILPSSEFSKLSARAQGLSYEFASDFSLHPKQLISFVLPYFFGNPLEGTYWGKGNFWELNGYLGIFPLILAFFSFASKRNNYKVIFIILGLFSLLFSLGRFTPIFPFFFNYVPIFDSFRVPARFLYIYAFSISILSGMGIDILLKNQNNVFLKRTAKLILFTGLILLIGSCFLYTNKSNISIYEKLILNNSYAVGLNHLRLFAELINGTILLSLVLFSFSLLILLKNKVSPNILKIVFTIIIVSDFWIFNSKILSIKKISEIYEAPAFIKELKKDDSIYRVFDKDGYYLPLIERSKIESITGIHSLYIKDYRDFIWSIGNHSDKPYESFFQINSIDYPVFLDLLNVKYISTNQKINNKNLKLISEYKNVPINYLPKVEKNLYIYKNGNILPRAFIAPNAIIIPLDKTIDKLKEKDFNPENQVIISENPNIPLINNSKFQEVTINYKEPNKIGLNFNLNEAGFLVLSEMYYPGWKAYDNNREIKIYRANYIFRSIYLNKGNHRIVFLYSPNSYKIGSIISLLTLLLLLIYLFKNKKNLLS